MVEIEQVKPPVIALCQDGTPASQERGKFVYQGQEWHFGRDSWRMVNVEMSFGTYSSYGKILNLHPTC